MKGYFIYLQNFTPNTKLINSKSTKLTKHQNISYSVTRRLKHDSIQYSNDKSVELIKVKLKETNSVIVNLLREKASLKQEVQKEETDFFYNNNSITIMNISIGLVNENDSKKSLPNQFKTNPHEGLMPFTLKLLSNCLADSKRQIDGIDFSRVLVVARLEYFEEKANKVIMTMNDNTGITTVVRGTGEDADDLQTNEYYEMVLSVREDKEQWVILCEKMRKVSSFEEINFHILKVITASLERQNMSNRK